MGKGASTLTNAQARALVRVAWEEGLRQVELANELEVKPITVARLIDQLAARGLARNIGMSIGVSVVIAQLSGDLQANHAGLAQFIEPFSCALGQAAIGYKQ